MRAQFVPFPERGPPHSAAKRKVELVDAEIKDDPKLDGLSPCEQKSFPIMDPPPFRRRAKS